MTCGQVVHLDQMLSWVNWFQMDVVTQRPVLSNNLNQQYMKPRITKLTKADEIYVIKIMLFLSSRLGKKWIPPTYLVWPQTVNIVCTIMKTKQRYINI